jgi:hypothetical protein
MNLFLVIKIKMGGNKVEVKGLSLREQEKLYFDRLSRTIRHTSTHATA